MQALFSRTAQARTSCRCMSCGQVAKAVARRTTTAAPKRRVAAGDIFTACYSTLLASAAIADAEVKSERRKQWDRVIEEARNEKPILEAGERDLEVELEQTTYSKISARSNSAYEDGSSSMLRRPARIFDQSHGSAIDSPLQERLKELDLRIKESLESMEAVSTTATPATVEGTTLTDVPEEDVEEWADEDPLPGTGFREPRSSLHLSYCEDSTSRLVMQLLGKISIFSDRDSYRSSKNLSNETKVILEAIEGLHSSFSKFPNFSWGSQDLVRATRLALHQSIYKICQMKTPGERDADSIIAKICYNLLISTTPPNIITYNIMIGELSRLKLHDVAEVIINSYFCDTRFAPTMETIQLMLDHYIAKGDRGGFHDMLDRLRCTLPVDKPGPGKPIGNMRIGMRSVKQLYRPKVQEWAMQQKVLHRNGFLIRKAPRDTGVFESIIRGCLRMKSIRRAIRYLKAAFREGQTIRSEWIHAIAAECVRSLNHNSAQSLMDAILSFWRDDEGNPRIDFSRNVRYATYQLLGLCGVSVTDGSPNFNTGHYIHRRENLQELLLHLQVESIKDRLRDSAEWILQLQFELGQVTLGGQEISSPQDRKRLREYSQNQILRSHISFIARKLHNSADRLCERQKETASSTYQCLSTASKERYDTETGDPRLSIASEDAYAERLIFLLQLVQEEHKPILKMEVVGLEHRRQNPNKFKALEPWARLDEPTVGVALSLGI